MQMGEAYTDSPTEPGREASQLCVLFADICGSTPMFEALGDHAASSIVGRCLNLMKAATLDQSGQIVETVGDAVLATFFDPVCAMRAAGEMMRRVELEPPVLGQGLAFRMGIHEGQVLPGEDQGICGDTVNTAARILSLAKRGQILASEAFVARLPSEASGVGYRALHSVKLKGKSDETAIFEILWQDRGDITVLAQRNASLPLQSCLILRHGGGEFRIEATGKALSMGRESGNQLVIDDRRISRRHATIEPRNGKFVLVDQSTNGTHVLVDDGTRYLLRLEEVALHGRGRIGLINPDETAAQAGLIDFEIL